MQNDYTNVFPDQVPALEKNLRKPYQAPELHLLDVNSNTKVANIGTGDGLSMAHS